jgi:hypothetical protein
MEVPAFGDLKIENKAEHSVHLIPIFAAGRLDCVVPKQAILLILHIVRK